MAKPRIFVSSTQYDLRYVRNDLDRFIRDAGYESVLNEKGNIPYGSMQRLEEYCYREIELCDILISIIGGRFGSESREDGYSISNLELKTAIERGKQVYVFVENTVLSEYGVFKINKESKDINYSSVDDLRIFEFIEEVYSLPLNNQIKGFDSVQEIALYLKEQWAGLFQSLLSENTRKSEISVIKELNNTSNTLNQLVNYLISEKEKGDEAISDILLSNHPAFEQTKKLLDVPYRVYFQNISELSALVEARKYETLFPFDESDGGWKAGYHCWKKKGYEIYFRVSEEIFENDLLKIYTQEEWNGSWIHVFDDEIPF